MPPPVAPSRPPPARGRDAGLLALLVLLPALLLVGARSAFATEDAADASAHVPDPRLVLERTVRAHESWARCLAWSGDGLTLASGGTDGAVRLWDPSVMEPVAAVTVEDHAPGVP